ncbi:MAG: holo-ACP synthase [Planctomycetes bacterium]|nr:holo-ACP synthase [Planctomycetota bacterium]
MIVGIGVDSIAIARIARLLEGPRFAARVFTAAERAYCEGRGRPAESFAARFCAKEAVMKCLGTGWTAGVRFVDIEVRREASGLTTVQLAGVAAATAAALGIGRWHLSLTHTDESATAFVIAER